MIEYHDREWGVPKLDDRDQFEHIILEIFQAGLSWLTILKKREAFRSAFAGFDVKTAAAFDDRDAARLISDAGIIRNRAKIAAAIHNARLFRDVSREFDGFFNFAVRFAPPKPHRFAEMAQIPASTVEAEAMSRELKRRGFKFLGPTICYAHLQSVGVVNDHLIDCWRYTEIERLRQTIGL